MPQASKTPPLDSCKPNWDRFYFTKHRKLNILTYLKLLDRWLFHKDLQEKKDIIIAEQYTQAKILITQKKTNESKILLENLIEANHKFYSPLSLYLMIDNNLENDSKKIINFFSVILNNNSIDEENLNLIKIKKAIYLISLDEEISAVETLNQIVVSNSVWRNLAISLIIEHYLSKNQKDKAEKYIQLLKNNNNK